MLVFLEGLPGSGKSTNSGFLFRQFEQNGIPSKWIHEMTRPHPVLFFNEANLTLDQLEAVKRNHPTCANLLDQLAIRYETKPHSVGQKSEPFSAECEKENLTSLSLNLHPNKKPS